MWRRRALGVLVVAGAATLAWAGGDSPVIVVGPRLVGADQVAGSSAAMTVMVTNQGTAGFTGRIVGNCGAPPAMRIGNGTGDPFSVSALATVPVTVECPAALPAGLHRCTFDIQTATNTSVATFDAFCATSTQKLLTITPSPVAFVAQTVGVESAPIALTLTNPTASQLDLDFQVDNPSFSIGAPCQNQIGCDAGHVQAGSTTTVDVLCKPLASGTLSGKLFVVGTGGVAVPPIELTCAAGAGSGGAVMTISPPNVSLQPVEVNGVAASTTLELANAGTTGSVVISSIALVDAAIAGAANDWTLSLAGQCTATPCSLGPAQQLTVHLRFDPSTFNARPATLIVNFADPNPKQSSISLDADGIGATVELVGIPGLEFGVVPLATQASPRVLALQNRGNRATALALSAAPTDPFVFPTTVSLPPGRAEVGVGCTSSSEVEVSTSLAITGADAPLPLAVPLHCEVRDTPLTTAPTSILLGEVRLGTTPPAIPLAIDRVGGGPAIALASVVLDDTSDPALSLGAPSALATPATTALTIAPTIEGAIANAVTVTPVTGPQLAVPVSGAVVRAALAAEDVMTLGTFCVGQPVGRTAISLTSTGTATVEVTGVELALGEASPLDLELSTPAAYPTSLAPGGEAIVLVRPKRSALAADVFDMLVWTTDAGPVSSTLTSRFIADGGAVAPQQLDFGKVPIRIANDDAQGVTLQNCSTDPLQLIEPVVPAPFQLTGEFPLLLEPAAKATFSILFLPTEVGPVDKQLEIASISGDLSVVTLRGTGVTGDGSDGDGDGDPAVDETSFYACGCRSSGDPTGVLAIALAVLCCVWRRRVSR